MPSAVNRKRSQVSRAMSVVQRVIQGHFTIQQFDVMASGRAAIKTRADSPLASERLTALGRTRPFDHAKAARRNWQIAVQRSMTEDIGHLRYIPIWD